eukprot:m.53358 g.53358  ORF g.53358 m.53358 type:complete len:281 (-) comp21748_c0_seq1:302-1144(-)
MDHFVKLHPPGYEPPSTVMGTLMEMFEAKGGHPSNPHMSYTFGGILIGLLALALWIMNGFRTKELRILEEGKQQTITERIKRADAQIISDALVLLHAAARNGNLIAYKRAFELHPALDVDALDSTGKSSLYIAAQQGKIEMLQHLLDAGANVDCCFRGVTPALAAITCSRMNKGCSTCAIMLMKAGADVSIQDAHGDSALLEACRQRDIDIIKSILAHSKDVATLVSLKNTRDEDAESILGKAELDELITQVSTSAVSTPNVLAPNKLRSRNPKSKPTKK